MKTKYDLKSVLNWLAQLSDDQFEIVNKVSARERKKILEQYPCLSPDVFIERDKKPHTLKWPFETTFDVLIGQGTSCRVRLCRVTIGKEQHYYALRKIQKRTDLERIGSNGKPASPIPRESIELHTTQEHIILDKISSSLPELTAHLSLPAKIFKKIKNTQESQYYQVSPLASFGNGDHYIEVLKKHEIAMKLAEQHFTYIAKSLIFTLAQLHQNGFYIRDIKPSNLLFCPIRGVLLADFGSAVSFEEDRIETEASRYSDVQYKHPLIAGKYAEHLTLRERASFNDSWALGISLLEIYAASHIYFQDYVDKIKMAHTAILSPTKDHIIKECQNNLRVLKQFNVVDNNPIINDILENMLDISNLADNTPIVRKKLENFYLNSELAQWISEKNNPKAEKKFYNFLVDLKTNEFPLKKYFSAEHTSNSAQVFGAYEPDTIHITSNKDHQPFNTTLANLSPKSTKTAETNRWKKFCTSVFFKTPHETVSPKSEAPTRKEHFFKAHVISKRKSLETHKTQTLRRCASK